MYQHVDYPRLLSYFIIVAGDWRVPLTRFFSRRASSHFSSRRLSPSRLDLRYFSLSLSLHSYNIFEGSSPLFVAIVPRYVAPGRFLPKHRPEQSITETCENSAAIRSALLHLRHQPRRLELRHHAVPSPPGAGLQQLRHDRRVPRRLRLANANLSARLSLLSVYTYSFLHQNNLHTRQSHWCNAQLRHQLSTQYKFIDTI